jgi:hypothetical protein
VTALLAECEPVERWVRVRAQFECPVSTGGAEGRQMIDDNVARRFIGPASGKSVGIMPDGMAPWFLRSIKTPPTHQITVGTLGRPKAFDSLRKRRADSAIAGNYFASDPRYSERIVAGWVFRRGLRGAPRGMLSDSARDIAITVEGDIVRDSYSLSSGVFWRGELPDWNGRPPWFDNDWFNDRALTDIVALLALPPLPRRPNW